LLPATEHLPRDPEALRALGRRHPRLRRLLIVEGGTLRFPPAGATIDEEERRLVSDTRFLWEHGGALAHPTGEGEAGAPPAHGWQAVPDGEGLGLLFWRRTGDGRLLGVSLGSAAVQAALVARLPVTVPDRAAGDERMALF